MEASPLGSAVVNLIGGGRTSRTARYYAEPPLLGFYFAAWGRAFSTIKSAPAGGARNGSTARRATTSTVGHAARISAATSPLWRGHRLEQATPRTAGIFRVHGFSASTRARTLRRSPRIAIASLVAVRARVPLLALALGYGAASGPLAGRATRTAGPPRRAPHTWRGGSDPAARRSGRRRRGS